MPTPKVPARTVSEETRQVAAEVAALTALADGIGKQIAKSKARLIELAAGVDSATVGTPFGNVNVTAKDAAIELIPEDYLAWVKANHPENIITTESVNPAFTKGLRERMTTVGVRVIDKISGEVYDFAYLGGRGRPYVAYPATNQQREAKVWAEVVVEQGVAELTGILESAVRDGAVRQVTA